MEELLLHLPAVHPLRCEAFAKIVVPWIESLRWSRTPGADLHGASFSELAVLFLLQTRTLLSALCTRKKTCALPEGQHPLYSFSSGQRDVQDF